MAPPKQTYFRKRSDLPSGSGPKKLAEALRKKAKVSEPKPPPEASLPLSPALHLLSTQNISPSHTELPTAIAPQITPQPIKNQPSPSLGPQLESATEAILKFVNQLNTENSEEGEDEDEERTVSEEVAEELGESFDEFKFSTSKAAKNFEKFWGNRSVIVERGMILSHFQADEFKLKQNFEERGWSKWAQFSGVAVVPIVQEFYANMVDVKFGKQECIVTMVRGVNLKVSPRDVRSFFGLKEVKKPQFPFADGKGLDKDSLAKVLTEKPNAEWGHKKNLAKNRLSPKFLSLHLLASSQLNPALNTSEISYEKGLLLYAIDGGLRVELGHLIWKNIAALFKTKKGVHGLPFAGFISEFVCKKNVVTELGEQVAKPSGPITASTRERSASHKKKKEEKTTEEMMEKILEKLEEVNAKVGEMKEMQGVIKNELQSQGRRIATMEAKLAILVPAYPVDPSSLHSDNPPFDV